jgi:hypothetical protein
LLNPFINVKNRTEREVYRGYGDLYFYRP